MSYNEIYISKEDEDDNHIGTIYGYSVDANEENWKNNILKNCHDVGFANFLISKILNSEVQKITILENLYVEEEFQGQGYGKELLEEFLDYEDYDIILLYSDNLNTQRKNFNLIKFYEDYDFERAKDLNDTYLLILDPNNLLNVNETNLEESLEKEYNSSISEKRKVRLK